MHEWPMATRKAKTLKEICNLVFVCLFVFSLRSLQDCQDWMYYSAMLCSIVYQTISVSDWWCTNSSWSYIAVRPRVTELKIISCSRRERSINGPKPLPWKWFAMCNHVTYLARSQISFFLGFVQMQQPTRGSNGDLTINEWNIAHS